MEAKCNLFGKAFYSDGMNHQRIFYLPINREVINWQIPVPADLSLTLELTAGNPISWCKQRYWNSFTETWEVTMLCWVSEKREAQGVISLASFGFGFLYTQIQLQ